MRTPKEKKETKQKERVVGIARGGEPHEAMKLRVFD